MCIFQTLRINAIVPESSVIRVPDEASMKFIFRIIRIILQQPYLKYLGVKFVGMVVAALVL